MSEIPTPGHKESAKQKKKGAKAHTGPLVSENPAKNHNTSDRKTVLKC